MDSLVPVASRHSEVAKHQWSGQTLPSLLSSAFRTRRRITSWCFSLNSSPLLPGSLLNGGFHSPETSHQAAAAAAAAARCCSLLLAHGWIYCDIKCVSLSVCCFTLWRKPHGTYPHVLPALSSLDSTLFKHTSIKPAQ